MEDLKELISDFLEYENSFLFNQNSYSYSILGENNENYEIHFEELNNEKMQVHITCDGIINSNGRVEISTFDEFKNFFNEFFDVNIIME